MGKKAIGEHAVISYDGDPVAAGDALRTPTGRTYGVLSVRVQQGGRHRGRQFVEAVVLDPVEVKPGTKVHPLVWYSRDKKRP